MILHRYSTNPLITEPHIQLSMKRANQLKHTQGSRRNFSARQGQCNLSIQQTK